MKYILLPFGIVSLIILTLLVQASAQYATHALTVTAEDRKCAGDAECTIMGTECSYCDCGVAVSKESEQRLKAEFEEMCGDYKGSVCDIQCPLAKVECIGNECRATVDKVLVLTNMIDQRGAEILFQQLRLNAEVHIQVPSYSMEGADYSKIIILGGHRAPQVGEMVSLLLTKKQKSLLMDPDGKPQKFQLIDKYGQRPDTIIYAGYDKERTIQAWMKDIKS